MKKKWRMKTKRPRKLHKRILSAFLVCMLLTGLFLSAANMEVSAASGLVDETIDTGNLYSQYSWNNYQLDFYVDTSWDWLPWNWLDGMGNNLSYAFYGLSNAIWEISVLLSSGTGYIVQQTYALDFISDMADSIGKNIQVLAGMSMGSKRFNADGFYTWMLIFVVLIVGGYMGYVGLMKRETTKAVSAAVNMFVIFLLTAAFIAYAPQYIKNINDFSSDLSNGVLELGTKLVMPGNDEMGKKATDKIRNNLFAVQVYKPWLLLQFGTTDENAIESERVAAGIDGNRIRSVLSVSPLANFGEDRQAAVKTEIETYKNANMTVTNVASRFGIVILIFFLNLIISIFVIIMCGMVVFTQLMFIIFALYLPLNFILSMLPTYNGLLKKAVLKLFNTILMRAGLTLLITIAFSLSAMIYSMSGDYPFLMVAFLQIVVFVGIYLKMDEILSMVALGDGSGNKRGRFLRSMGRYMVMRKLFGRRYSSGGRRAAVSRNAGAGNGTGGGTGGNTGDGSKDTAAPSGESGTQRASSHTNNSGGKPVRKPVGESANEPVRNPFGNNENASKNDGRRSESEWTTIYQADKMPSAGTKAGKRVGMVMDSGKRLKDRMDLVKENVKNTPTEIKYQAGLHRKAMEQNVKDFKEGIAGERNRRETGRLQERNRIQADAGRKRREMYLAKRRSETALKRYDGIDFHQRIPVNGKELDKYRGVDGLNRGAKAGRSFIDSRGQVRKASDEKLQNMAGSEERIRKNDQKAERIGTPLEDIRYKQSVTRLPYSNRDVRKELGTYGTMLNSADQEKFMEGLHQQKNEDLRLQERNGGQSVRETGTGTGSVPGRTVIRSGGNAKDLRNDVLTERRRIGSTERKMETENADRRNGRK
ncbi:CD3337/EF1877 family mobilome membrane protein [Roseburia sp.]|uniref:CD3337/EF1877 family mobilome membrane protein n=1 Tax=Roseburia sp. TaxID=2049040 RepID=UPI003521B043